MCVILGDLAPTPSQPTPTGARGLVQIGIASRLFHGALYRLFLNVMAAHLATTRIGGEFGRGKHILQNPLSGRNTVFSFQCMGHIHRALDRKRAIP